MLFKAGKNGQNNHKRRLEDQFQKQYTTIKDNVDIQGSLNTYDNLRIGGNLKGQINSRGVVWILKNAEIEGNISANGLIVEGYVHGNVQCTGKAELRPGAQIKGEIACARIAISRDCALEGKVKMLEGKLKTFVAQRNMNENELKI
jgi:cytoskeletal protein CcmA (bactofilin family)